MELAAPAIWLRDNCSCERCRHANGQKLHGVGDLAAELLVAGINEIGDEIRVRFDGDPHEAVFDRDWLSSWWPEGPDDGRTEDAKMPWPADIPECDWDRYLAAPGSRLAALDAVLRTGFVLLHGVPTDEGTVLEVADSFGFVRVTNYGDLFDVRVEADPNNLAFTSLPITPHTDTPTAIRYPPSSCCTACATRPAAATPAWSTASARRRSCAPSSRTRSRC